MKKLTNINTILKNFLLADDIEFFISYLKNIDEAEMTLFLRVFPDFITNLSGNDRIDSLKAGTYQKVMAELRRHSDIT